MFTKFLKLLFLLFFLKLNCNEPNFVVLITSYNNAQWHQLNLSSVFNQTYQNYRIIYIDDCSIDKTTDLVEEFTKQNKKENKLQLIRNKKRNLKMANMYNAIHSCDDNEIIVILDGDDWFVHNDALKEIAEEYKNNNIWLTYGNFCNINDPKYINNISEENLKNVAHKNILEIPNRLTRKEIIEQIVPGHPFTFYAWLFKLIKLKDLLFQGYLAPVASDTSFICPIMELCGDRFKFIPKVYYIHNIINELNDHKVNGNLQMAIADFVANKERYQQIEKKIVNNFENINYDQIVFSEKLEINQFKSDFIFLTNEENKDLDIVESLKMMAQAGAAICYLNLEKEKFDQQIIKFNEISNKFNPNNKTFVWQNKYSILSFELPILITKELFFKILNKINNDISKFKNELNNLSINYPLDTALFINRSW